MPNHKDSAKSKVDKSTNSVSTADTGRLESRDTQVDDPIIVKGGSISLSFDQHNFRDMTASPVEPNRRFDHEFGPALQRLKIFRAGAIFFQTGLQPTDIIMICYQGSSCPDVAP